MKLRGLLLVAPLVLVACSEPPDKSTADAADSMSEAVEERGMMDKMKDMGGDAMDQTKDFGRSAMDKASDMGDTVADKAVELKDKTVDGSKSLYDSAKEKGADLMNNMSNSDAASEAEEKSDGLMDMLKK